MDNNENTLNGKVFGVIVASLGLADEGDVSMDSSLIEIGFESLTFIKTIIALESEFDFEFDDERLLAAEFQTFRDMVDYVLLEIELG